MIDGALTLSFNLRSFSCSCIYRVNCVGVIVISATSESCEAILNSICGSHSSTNEYLLPVAVLLVTAGNKQTSTAMLVNKNDFNEKKVYILFQVIWMS